MKAVFKSDLLASEFAVAAMFAPPRSPNEVFQNVKLTVGDGSASLEATNGETGVRCEIGEGVETKEQGIVLLPVQRVGSILREFSEENIEISSSGNSVQFKGKGSKYKCQVASPDSFPSVVQCSSENLD